MGLDHQIHGVKVPIRTGQCKTIRINSLQVQWLQTLILTQTGTPTTWIQDSGASFHVTGESQNIQQLSPFEGPDQIYIGNGQGLPIHSTGSSTFISPINSKVSLSPSSNSVASPTSVDPTADSNSNSSPPINADFSPTIEPEVPSPIFEAGSTSVQDNSPQSSDLSPSEAPHSAALENVPVVNSHPMQTRSKSGIHLPRVNPTLLLAHCEPKSVKQPLADSNWFTAMKQEYEALINNMTWDLVSLPPYRKAVGCKWVFRVKENADGTVNR